MPKSSMASLTPSAHVSCQFACLAEDVAPKRDDHSRHADPRPLLSDGVLLTRRRAIALSPGHPALGSW